MMKSNKDIMRVVLLLVLGLAACAASRQESYVNSHPGLSAEVKQAILSGQITYGMTPAEVRVSWGAPDYEGTRSLPGGHQEMTWRWGSIITVRDPRGQVVTENTQVITNRHVVFLAGRVTSFNDNR